MNQKQKLNHIKDLGFIRGFLIGTKAGLDKEGRAYKDLAKLEALIEVMQKRLVD